MAPTAPTEPLRRSAVGIAMGIAVLWAAIATGVTFAAPGDDAEAQLATEPSARAVAPERFHCKIFRTPLDAAVDTRDHSTDLGRWVMDQEARGWAVQGVDFEVGQKPTGFAEGFVQICMTPVLEPA
ncbi:MAG: hypothetical protein KTR31_03370 [Myxococcales bacterium]|nr:hypothetical protein [Myxococcales bacterium]